MQQNCKELIQKLEKIHANLHLLKKDDHEFLIQIGATVEKLAADIPENRPEILKLIQLSLEGLQKIYEKNVADFKNIVDSIIKTFEAAIQALQSNDEKASELLVKKAWQNLWEALEINQTDHAFYESVQEKGQVPAITHEPEPTTEPPQHSDHDEAVDVNENSLNDIAAFLVQIEPDDIPGLTKVQHTVRAIVASKRYNNTVNDNLNKAITALDSVISRAIPNPNIIYGEISRYIETSLEIVETATTDTTPSKPMPSSRQGASSVKPATVQIEKQSPATEPSKNSGAAAKPSVVKAAKKSPTVEPSANSAATERGVEFFQLPPDADNSLLGEFVTESREYIENSEGALLALESNPEDSESVNIVFRAFHTIKGTSAFLGLNGISEFAHKAESFYSRIRDGEIRCVGNYADLSLQAVDMVKELIDSVEKALNGEPMMKPSKYDMLINMLTNPDAHNVSDSPQENKPTPDPIQEDDDAKQIDSAQNKDLALSVQNTNASRTAAKQTSTFIQQTTESSVRVTTGCLDRLIDIVGELVIAQSMVAQDKFVARNENHELLKKVMHASKIVRELQDLTMLMRMVPLKPTFQKMARVVRDVARKSEKVVEFVSEGEDVEIDRNMVDHMNDPLVHMLRNAVDHGIEPPDVRVKNGKAPKGTIKLSAYHSGGSVVLEINDDGRGLDRDRIIEKAISKGMIESGNNMTDNEVFNIIFEPGFSTAPKITSVSGRGVGLDVVRKGVEVLRGRIEIQSKFGIETTFVLRLPLTLAITDGMLVKVGGQRYIIPIISISMSFRPTRDTLSTIAGKGEMAMLREQLLPLFRLHRLFDIQGAVEDPTEGILVVVDDGERSCAILVDELLGQQQVVAKSLGAGIGKVQAISGGAILGDGRVGLILDTTELLTLARTSQDYGDSLSGF